MCCLREREDYPASLFCVLGQKAKSLMPASGIVLANYLANDEILEPFRMGRKEVGELFG